MQELIMCLMLLSIISVIYMSRSHNRAIRELVKDYHKSEKAGKSKKDKKKSKKKDKKKKPKEKEEDLLPEELLQQPELEFQDVAETESIELGTKRQRESDRHLSKLIHHPLGSSTSCQFKFFDRQKKFYECLVSEIPEIQENKTSSLGYSYEESTKNSIPKQSSSLLAKNILPTFKTNHFQAFTKNDTHSEHTNLSKHLFLGRNHTGDLQSDRKESKNEKTSTIDHEKSTSKDQRQGFLYSFPNTSGAKDIYGLKQQSKILSTDSLLRKKDLQAETADKNTHFLPFKPAGKDSFNPGMLNLTQTGKKQSTEKTLKRSYSREDDYPSKRAKKFTDEGTPTKKPNFNAISNPSNQTHLFKATLIPGENADSKQFMISDPQAFKKITPDSYFQGNNPFEDASKDCVVGSDTSASNFNSANTNNSSKFGGLFSNPSFNTNFVSVTNPTNSLFQKQNTDRDK